MNANLAEKALQGNSASKMLLKKNILGKLFKLEKIKLKKISKQVSLEEVLSLVSVELKVLKAKQDKYGNVFKALLSASGHFHATQFVDIIRSIHHKKQQLVAKLQMIELKLKLSEVNIFNLDCQVDFLEEKLFLLVNPRAKGGGLNRDIDFPVWCLVEDI